MKLLSLVLIALILGAAYSATVNSYFEQGTTAGTKDGKANTTPWGDLSKALTDTTSGCSSGSAGDTCNVIIKQASATTYSELPTASTLKAGLLVVMKSDQGISTAQTGYVKLDMKGKAITLVDTSSLTLLRFSDIKDSTADMATTKAAIIAPVAGSSGGKGEVILEDVSVANTIASTGKTITLVNTQAKLTIKGGKYTAMPGADGLFVVKGPGTTAAATKGELVFANDATANAPSADPTFSGCGTGATAQSKTSVIFALSNAATAKGKAVFDSNVDTPAFTVTGKSSLLSLASGSTLNKNTAAQAQIQADTEAIVLLDTVTFTTNKNLLATATAKSLLAPISIVDSWMQIKGGSFKTNEGKGAGVFAVKLADTFSKIATLPAAAKIGTSQTDFLANNVEFASNVGTTASTSYGVGSIVSTVSNVLYKTIIDDTNGAKGTYVVKGMDATKSTGNKVTTTAQANPIYYVDATYVLGAYTTTISKKTITAGDLQYLNGIPSNANIPDITFNYVDVWGHTIPKADRTFTKKLQVWLWNRDLAKSYYFGKKADGTTASPNGGRRVLANAGTLDVIVLPTAVDTAIKSGVAEFKALYDGIASVKTKASTTKDCWANRNWEMVTKGTYAAGADLNTFSLKGFKLDTTETAWQLVVQGELSSTSAFKMMKNYFEYTVNSAKTTAFITPMVFTDPTCPKAAAGTVCKTTEYVDASGCKACDAACTTCSGAGATACITCADGSLPVKTSCKKCATGEILDGSGACVALAAAKTAVGTIEGAISGKKGATLVADVTTLTNYYSNLLSAAKVTIDAANPCATSATVNCSGKGTCTAGKCKCTTGNAGALCGVKSADLTAAKAGITKAVAAIKADYATITDGQNANDAADMAFRASSNPDALDDASTKDLLAVISAASAKKFKDVAGGKNAFGAATNCLQASVYGASSSTAATKTTNAAAALKAQTDITNNLLKNQLTSLKGSLNTPIQLSGLGSAASIQVFAPSAVVNAEVAGKAKFVVPKEFKSSTLKDPSTTAMSNDVNPYALADTKTMTTGPVVSLEVQEQKTAGTLTKVTVDATALASKTIDCTYTRTATTKGSVQYWAATKWDTKGITQPTDQAAKSLVFKTDHLTAFAAVNTTVTSGGGGSTGGGGLSGLNLVMNFALAAILGFFAMMF